MGTTGVTQRPWFGFRRTTLYSYLNHLQSLFVVMPVSRLNNDSRTLRTGDLSSNRKFNLRENVMSLTTNTLSTLKNNCDWIKEQQDGRPAPAYFSPNYKYVDQFLQTVKNKTTVLNLVFKEFLQTSIPPLISVRYAKGYHDFPLKNFCLTVPKKFVEEPFCVSENFCYQKILWIRRGGGREEVSKIFRRKFFLSRCRKFRKGTL